jgi:hypothetical protein
MAVTKTPTAEELYEQLAALEKENLDKIAEKGKELFDLVNGMIAGGPVTNPTAARNFLARMQTMLSNMILLELPTLRGENRPML